MTSFSIPFVRNKKTLEGILSSSNRISNMYGGVRDLEAVGFSSFVEIIENTKKEGTKFYLTVSRRDGVKQSSKLNLDQIPFDKLIIDDLTMLDILPGNIPIYLSTILGFKSPENISRIVELKKKYNITDVCLHHDAIFDDNLIEVVRLLKNTEINPIILVNESCYMECPFREAHYKLHGERTTKDHFQQKCVEKRINDPRTLLDLSGFLHPMQIQDFSETSGITSFKIAGRGKSDSWIKQTVLAYDGLKVPDNLMDIVVFTEADGIFYVSSEAVTSIKLHELSKKERLKAAQKLIDEEKIKVNKPLWMGIGLYQSYIDSIRQYAEQTTQYGNTTFVLADEIQEHNVALNNITERERIRLELTTICGKLEKEIDSFNFETWCMLSGSDRYKELLNKVNNLYKSEDIFREQIKRLTSRKIHCEKDHPKIDKLAKYACEEIASIFYFAERGYIKAGNRREIDYDRLAQITLRNFNEKLEVKLNHGELEFMYLDKL